MSLDSWGCVTIDNQSVMIERSSKYKKNLLNMSVVILNILENFNKNIKNIIYFISDGTLLGAYRNNKMIDHDYDFDYGLYSDVKTMNSLYEFMTNKINEHNKNNNTFYKTRVVNDYAHKIEIYDESCGKHGDIHGGWYNVCIDIQLMMDMTDNEELIEIQYFKDNFNKKMFHKKINVIPTQFILFENINFPCPNNVKEYLEENYGCLEYGAVYDPITCKYVKK